MVYDSFTDSPINRKRIEECLRRIDDRLVRRRGTSFDDTLAADDSVWARNALERHNEVPFQAIITEDHGLREEKIIVADDLDENHPLMRIASGVVSRNAQKFAQAASLLLKTGAELVLADPYINLGERRWQNTLSALLETAANSPYRNNPPLVKMHSGIGSGHGNDRDIIERRTKDFRRNCEHFLPEMIPANVHLEIFVWLDRDNGERFHNRYIMSERAGLCLATGLDEALRFLEIRLSLPLPMIGSALRMNNTGSAGNSSSQIPAPSKSLMTSRSPALPDGNNRTSKFSPYQQ